MAASQTPRAQDAADKEDLCALVHANEIQTDVFRVLLSMLESEKKREQEFARAVLTRARVTSAVRARGAALKAALGGVFL